MYFPFPSENTDRGLSAKKMHPTETAEQNVRRAKNNYVIAGEIHRRKKESRKVHAVMSVGRIWNLFWKRIIVMNLPISATRDVKISYPDNYLMYVTIYMCVFFILNKFLLSM